MRQDNQQGNQNSKWARIRANVISTLLPLLLGYLLYLDGRDGHLDSPWSAVLIIVLVGMGAGATGAVLEILGRAIGIVPQTDLEAERKELERDRADVEAREAELKAKEQEQDHE